MAFVYKADRDMDVRINNELGPGEYQGPQVFKVKKTFAPFNSTAQRDHKIKQKLITPGPGTYQVQRDNSSEKVLVSSLNQEIKIIEVPKQNGVFKSQTQRFDDKHFQNPGPGTYQVAGDIAKSKEKLQSTLQEVLKEEVSSKTNILNIMKQKNKNQLVVPSVPSKKHAFGYSEGQGSKLELNSNPFLQEINRQIGPGQYNIKDTFETNKGKGKTWGSVKTKRKVNQVQTATNTNVGPGTYDMALDPNVQVHKCKASSQFLSKSLRMFDQNRGTVSQKVIGKKLQSQANLMGDMDYEQEEEYEIDAVPGPGSYYSNKNHSCFKLQSKPEKYQFFGSGSIRFTEKQNTTTQQIGPGNYNPHNSYLQPKSFNQQSIPFMAIDKRFSKPNLQENPGPGQYNQKRNIEDNVIEKLQKGYKGKFGTKQRRFQQNVESEDLPGPGQYVDPNQYIDNLQMNFDKKSYNFKSGSSRNVFEEKKFITPPIGNYQLDYYDMNKQIQKIKEDEAELEIKRPPFYSNQKRFDLPTKDTINKEQDEEQLFENNYQSGKTLNDVLNQRNKKKNVPFNSQQKRFNYKVPGEEKPGPGTYNDQPTEQWNKRTYNILFADI